MLRASTLAAAIVAALAGGVGPPQRASGFASKDRRARCSALLEPRLGGSRGNLTALDALALTRVPFHTQATGEGLYVDRIAQFPSAGTAGWALKVNGVMQTARTG